MGPAGESSVGKKLNFFCEWECFINDYFTITIYVQREIIKI